MSDPVPNDAARVIEAFGGIRPMAKKLGVAVTTIQGWKERNAIPIRRLDEIRAAAAREGIDLGALAIPAEEPLEPRGATPPAEEAPHTDAPAGAGPVEAEPLRAEKVVDTPSGLKEAESVAAGPTVEASPARPAGWNRPLAFGAGFAGMLVIGALIGWAVADRLSGREPDREAAAALETRLAAAEKTAAAAGSAATAAAAQAGALAQRLEAAEAAAAALGEKLAGHDDGAAVRTLGAAVRALQADLKNLSRTVASIRADRTVTKVSSDLADLKASVAALRQAVADAADRPDERDGENAATREALSELSQGLAALSDKVAAFDRDRLAAAESALSGLAARVAAAEARLKSVQSSGGATGIVVALSQLRAAAASGRPYAAALAVAQELAGADASAAAVLDALAPAAASGAPILPVLRREFDALSVRLLAAAAPAQDASWIDRAWNKVKSTVVVRRTGRGVTGESISALVAQAEVELADGDLAGAIALVRRMPAAAQESASGWLARAERRAGIDAALARLDALLPMLSGAAPDGKTR